LSKNEVVVHLSGGLGNQMFQYMAGAGLAKETERELLINTNWFLNPRLLNRNSPAYLTKRKIDIVQFKAIAATRVDRSHTPRDGRMERIISKLSKSIRQAIGVGLEGDFENGTWKNAKELNRIFGFFMSPKFFLGVNPNLLFGKLNPPMTSWSKEIIEKIGNTKSIGVHIRLGDYVALGDKVIPTESYFLSGVEYLKSIQGNKSKVYFFTDEPDRLSELFPTLTARGVVISPPKYTTPAENLIVLSQCKAFVCSNSTFSWWGAALSTAPKSHIVRPSYFYTAKAEIDSHKDLWSPDTARLHPLSGNFT